MFFQLGYDFFRENLADDFFVLILQFLLYKMMFFFISQYLSGRFISWKWFFCFQVPNALHRKLFGLQKFFAVGYKRHWRRDPMVLFCWSRKVEGCAGVSPSTGFCRNFCLLSTGLEAHGIVGSADDTIKRFASAARAYQVYFFVGRHQDFLKDMAAICTSEFENRHLHGSLLWNFHPHT